MASNNNKRKAEGMVDPIDGSGGDSDGPPTRKKAHVAAPTDDDDGPLQLPAVVWGHVLDFMPYAQVRSALRICKTVANDAVDHVQTINIMKSTQLNVPAARRFPSVRELNILCLLKSVDGSNNMMLGCELCPDTVGRAVFFAASFPKVERVVVGGYNFGPNVWIGIQHVWYNPMFCIAPQNHRDMFDTLVKGFFGALKAGLFPHVTSIGGVIDHTGCCALAFEIITYAIEQRLTVYEENDLVRDGGEHATTFVQTTADTLSKLPHWEDGAEYPRDFFHDYVRIFFLSDAVFAKIDMLLARSAFDPRECTGEEKFMYWQNQPMMA